MLDTILNNLKTSIAGTASAIAAIIALFGFDVDPMIISSLLAVIVAVLGLLAKD